MLTVTVTAFEVEKCNTVFQTSQVIFSQNPEKLYKINMKGQYHARGIRIFTFLTFVLGISLQWTPNYFTAPSQTILFQKDCG